MKNTKKSITPNFCLRNWTYLALIAAFLTGCSTDRADFSNPNELIIGMAVTEDYERQAEKVAAFKAFLEKALEMKVKVYRVTNGTAVIEAIKADKIHLGNTGAFSYIVGKSKADIIPLVTTAAVSPDTIHNYWSSLVTPADSPLDSFEQIKEMAGDLTLAWAYPTSTSGHLIPRAHLQDLGVVPDDFKSVLVAENHVASLYNCVTRKVDLAAVSNLTIKEYLKRGRVDSTSFRVIWNSPPIPRGPVFVSGKLNPALSAKIQTVMTSMHETDPETAKKLHYQHPYRVKYIPIDDSYYDELRTMAYETGVLTKE